MGFELAAFGRERFTRDPRRVMRERRAPGRGGAGQSHRRQSGGSSRQQRSAPPGAAGSMDAPRPAAPPQWS